MGGKRKCSSLFFHIKERASLLFSRWILLWKSRQLSLASLSPLSTTFLLSFLKENTADDGVVLCRDEQSATADGADLSLWFFFVWLVNCPSKKRRRRPARRVYNSVDLEGVLCLCVPFLADGSTQWLSSSYGIDPSIVHVNCNWLEFQHCWPADLKKKQLWLVPRRVRDRNVPISWYPLIVLYKSLFYHHFVLLIINLMLFNLQRQ